MIFYHGSYLGGATHIITPFFTGRNFLISMEYPRFSEYVKNQSSGFILDNGAFTLWKKGFGDVDVYKYIDFVKSFDSCDNYDYSFIPDKIDGTEKQNDDYIEKWLNLYGDFKSVPVWHYHESFDRLRLLLASFDMVALGSSGEYATINSVDWKNRTNKIFEVYRNMNCLTKLHGLRVLNPKIFTQYEYFSGDSSNLGRNNGSYMKRHGLKDRYEAMVLMAKNLEKYQSKYENYKQNIINGKT